MASSSSSSPSAPAFSSQSWNHDVFLSFRGEDTRKNFVDHLYAALVLQGIDTYKDDESLRQGKTIRPALMKGIEESQIAIIVFSKNYADSSWCLDELAHIMECKKTRGQIVVPVFYGVEPSEVRKQTNIYGEAFVKHKLEKKNKVESRKKALVKKNKIESWKKALKDAGNLSGWEPKNIANGHETKVIKEIVDKILLMIELVNSSANEELIGVAARMQRLKSELQIGSGGVRMIGIWGVGGGGKTTLASCIYAEISRKFDGCCFIANTREESIRRGLEELKKEILSQTGANSVGRGRCLINTRLRNRKVLIVIDDVDRLEQLKILVGSPDWFGEGSRIIITTRDEHLLKAHNVVVHNISLLQGDEAVKLFRKHAFRGSIPMKDYEHLSEEVVSYAGGLPLALTVLGSSLCDKNIDQWRSALARLKEIPDEEILQKLKVSFDGLTKLQKDLFLDIACFYRRQYVSKAMKMLDACGFYPDIGVEELRQKALITISRGKFDMHDLVQEMGHHIVRGEHPKNPEKHSRVWKDEDILTLCAMHATMELDKIEAIDTNYYSFENANLPPPIVSNMRNLRYIRWKGDIHPADPPVSNFPPIGLCCLILSEGVRYQLWNGYKHLKNLKIMELWQLKNLIVTPNFDGIPFLERFLLNACPKLEEVHSSFGGLERLVSLRIEDCSGIKKFPCITRQKKLETLSFEDSPRVFELSEIQQKTDNLGDEDMSSAIQELFNLYHMRFYFSSRDLRKLNLENCNLGDEAISSAVWELPNLEELNLSQNKFSRLNFSLIQIPRLKFIDVSFCSKLKELSRLPSSIAVLKANDCKLLTTIGDISNCKWLWKVWLEGTPRVDLFDAWILVDSTLEGNAIDQDHFISVGLHPKFPHPKFLRPKFHMRSLNRLFNEKSRTMHLPDDWYNDFCGFLIHIVTYEKYPNIDITIKKEVDVKPLYDSCLDTDEELELLGESDEELEFWRIFDEEPEFWLEFAEELEMWRESDEELEFWRIFDEEPEFWLKVAEELEMWREFDEELELWRESDEELEQASDEDLEQGSDEELDQPSDEELEQESDEGQEQESDEELERESDRTMTYVGYVSFNSLRHTTSLNSTYKVISIYVNGYMSGEEKIGAELVPRKSKDDLVQTTTTATGDSEFWDVDHARTFTIEPGSESSVKIGLQPYK